VNIVSIVLLTIHIVHVLYIVRITQKKERPSSRTAAAKEFVLQGARILGD